jgi:hypothetical protein
MEIKRVTEVLAELGRRLRAARIERNDTMEVFAQRLGVSVGTVPFATTAEKFAVQGGESLQSIGADVRGRLESLGD